MTDYSQLTNEELRRKIAEAGGWKDLHPYRRKYDPEHPDYYPFLEGKNDANEFPDNFYDVPDWTTDIGEAWKLLQRVIGRTKRRPTISLVAEHEWRVDLDWDDFIFYADTAPRAICLAYLAWKEATK